MAQTPPNAEASGSSPQYNDAEPSRLADGPTETTALIPKVGSVEDVEDDVDQQPTKGRVRVIFIELIVLLRGSIPVILAYALQNSLQAVSVLIVGRLSAEALATAAFSYMFAMATGWLIALGGTTAIDTLASASYTGSANPHDIGIILQRAIVVLGLFYIPVIAIWFASEPLFRALGQDEYLCKDASRFLMVLAPGGLGYIYFECVKKYLQAQEIMRAGTYALLISSPLNALLNYLLIYPLGMGLLGAPLATGISYWVSFVLIVLYTKYFSRSKGWGGWTKTSLSLRECRRFARLAFLGVLHVGTEWWAFEIVTIVAGMLKPAEVPLAAQSVIATSDQVLNTIPFGLGVATTARVGNLLGARKPTAARRSANISAWLSMLLGTIVLAVLIGVKDVYAKIFNDDTRVIKMTSDVLPYVALFQIADGLNGSCGGSLRAQGRQHIGAAVNILSYYCGALPLGIWLAFNGWGLAGLWLGQCIALYLVGILEWAIVAFSNWEKQVDRAFQRMERKDSVVASGEE